MEKTEKTEKKTVLVTGSSRSIGKAAALEYAKKGWNVAVNARNADKLNEAQSEISKYTDCISVNADVSNYEQIKKGIDSVYQKFGKIDVLINNAGIAHISLFSDMTPEQYYNMININLMGVMNCCHCVIDDMVRRKSGSIINISSMWGSVGASCEAVYSASKGGVNSFTKALAKELAPSGIRINAIACGVVNTQMNDMLSDDEKNELKDSIPMMRFAEPEEIARFAYMLSDEASSYLTGQVIMLDGAMN